MGATMEHDFDTVVAMESTNLLPNLASFLAVVAEGSFTRAAKRSGVDKTVLSRRVKRLEESLQVRLLNRTTRSVHVTEAGRALFERAAGPLGDVLLALGEANDADAARGTVRVATIAPLDAVWAEVLTTLRAEHPDLLVELSTADSLVSLVDEGFDVAVRTGFLPDSTLVARKLATWRYVLCGAPAWVDRHGDPADPSAVAGHWALYVGIPNADRWRFERGDVGMELQVRPAVAANNSFVLKSAVLQGIAVTAFPPYMVADELATGRLVRLCPDWRVAHAIPIWGVLPHRSFVPARVEAVLSAMRAALRRREPRWTALSD